MYCSNCGKEVVGNINFCPECGAKIKVSQQVIELNNEAELQAINTSQSIEDNIPNQNQKAKKNKSTKKKVSLIIVLLVLLTMIIGAVFFFVLRGNNTEQYQSVSDVPSTLQKLKEDYENGNIDVNKYFTELVYFEYDSSKLDEKYKSDSKEYLPGCYIRSETFDLLENHKDELDEDIVRKYIENVMMSNVALGEESDDIPENLSSKKYEIRLLNNESDKDNAANHRLNKVCLSGDEHFLIWYTDTGSDAITEDQLNSIAGTLERSISQIEDKFKVEYSYSPRKDSVLNEDYKKTKEILQKNGIQSHYMDTAMNVYVYDTGSENSLAYYTNPYGEHLLLDFVATLGIMDNDGKIAFPNIVINKRGFLNETSLKQVCTHELFHHFQHIFCAKTAGKNCEVVYYSEGMANFASALANNEKAKTNNTFLNGWATIYATNASKTLSEIKNKKGGVGYGTFPYFYAYSQVVSNWAEVLMNAHNEKEPYSYIMEHTSKEDLVKVSQNLTYNVLAKDFDNSALYSSKDIELQDVIKFPKKIEGTINPGAIAYYEINSDNALKAISGNSDYVSVSLYGYKDNIFGKKYKEISSIMENMEVDLSYYARYDKLYLAISNADITKPYNYSIIVGDAAKLENSEFETTFKNYNIEIQMDMTLLGFTTRSVSKGIVDELHQKEYLETITNVGGQVDIGDETIDINNNGLGSLLGVSSKIYSDFNSGYSYMTQPQTYFSNEDVWIKEKGVTQKVDLGVILDNLINMKNVTKIDENHYKVKMTKDDVKALMSSGNAKTSLIKGDIYADVYTENGYITKLEYDFSDIIKRFEGFTITIKFYNYNNAGDVEIPISVFEKAKEQ